MTQKAKITAVLFDFGGVLAEEGFKDGLQYIAIQNELDPDILTARAFRIIYETGFVLGKVREDVFWKALGEQFSIRERPEKWREEILTRFSLRPWMLKAASELKKRRIVLGLLTDQCHWLDELNERDPFFDYFDHIFNSYYTHISKKNPLAFDRVSKELQIPPENILFIDDHEAHILRAQQRGLQTILYRDKKSFFEQLNRVVYKCDVLQTSVSK
jgi:putative hydrolase of the HAD superfamily